MREKVDTAYFLWDPRKFDSIADAEKELNRLRAICVRWKKKQGDEINCLLGLSVTRSEYVGRMGYDKPKSKGGKKQFLCTQKIRSRDRSTGAIVRFTPSTAVLPHLHILINGYGASSCSEHILKAIRKHTPTYKYRKEHLKSAERIDRVIAYIESQSTILRRV